AIKAAERAREADEQREQIRTDLLKLQEANSHAQEGRYSAEQLQHWARALAQYNKALELRPDNAHFWFERGEFFARIGLLDRAAADYAEAFKRQTPTFAYHWYAHALLQKSVGNGAGYRQTCRDMPGKVTQGQHPMYEAWLARTCTLGPD